MTDHLANARHNLRREHIRHRLDNAARRLTLIGNQAVSLDDDEVHNLEHVAKDIEHVLDKLTWG